MKPYAGTQIAQSERLQIRIRIYCCGVLCPKHRGVTKFGVRVGLLRADSDGHWVSLSGVRFGGYVYNVQVHLEGTSEIELVGSSYIQIGV